MRTVYKSRPGPVCLDAYPPGSDWYKDVKPPCPEEVRKQLVGDQRGICCYCMARIRVDRMRVEHFLPRSNYKQHQTDWENLLGACQGGETEPNEFRSCDVKKEDEDVSLHPLDPKLHAKVTYSASGKVVSEEHQEDVEKRLNLNHSRLIKNRISAWKRYNALLERKLGKGRTWPVRALRDELQTLREAQEYVEFVGFIEYLLERAIRRHGG